MRLCAALTCLACFALTACGELPHPFEDAKLPPHAPMLAMSDAFGVVVEPVQGAPDAGEKVLADAMALALQGAEIPASTSAGNVRSYHLAGTVTPVPGVDTDWDIHWSMRDSAGTEIGTDVQRMSLRPGIQPDPAVLAGPMRAEAPKLAALIQDQAPVEHAGTRHLMIRSIAGAPGDGATSLKRALTFLLKRNGAALTEDAKTPDTIAIACTIEAKPAANGQDHIKILWHVLKPDGSEVGVVTQENDVPRAAIEGQWGDIAMAVADAAAPDILRVASTVPAG